MMVGHRGMRLGAGVEHLEAQVRHRGPGSAMPSKNSSSLRLASVPPSKPRHSRRRWPDQLVAGVDGDDVALRLRRPPPRRHRPRRPRRAPGRPATRNASTSGCIEASSGFARPRRPTCRAAAPIRWRRPGPGRRRRPGRARSSGRRRRRSRGSAGCPTAPASVRSRRRRRSARGRCGSGRRRRRPTRRAGSSPGTRTAASATSGPRGGGAPPRWAQRRARTPPRARGSDAACSPGCAARTARASVTAPRPRPGTRRRAASTPMRSAPIPDLARVADPAPGPPRCPRSLSTTIRVTSGAALQDGHLDGPLQRGGRGRAAVAAPEEAQLHGAELVVERQQLDVAPVASQERPHRGQRRLAPGPRATSGCRPWTSSRLRHQLVVGQLRRSAPGSRGPTRSTTRARPAP